MEILQCWSYKLFHCWRDPPYKIPQGGYFEPKFIRICFRILSIVVLQESVFSIAEMEIKYLQLMPNSN